MQKKERQKRSEEENESRKFCWEITQQKEAAKAQQQHNSREIVSDGSVLRREAGESPKEQSWEKRDPEEAWIQMICPPIPRISNIIEG
jgi:hypothetical protein